MLQDDEFQKVEINSLILDDENPRFASSMLVQKVKEITENTIIEHLLKHGKVEDLAKRINSSHGLHKTEIIACYKKEDAYIVLEGNRRICACKLLLNPKLIPDPYKSTFPSLDEITKENIEEINIYVYPNRESAQAYLSDRHITGVEKWSALEKNNYYMNLFQVHRRIDKVKEFTNDSISDIKDSIKKYQFFMEVFNILQVKHNDIEIEKLAYLPMVDLFMGVLVGNNKYVGLSLRLDKENLKHLPSPNKKEAYEKILMLVGEACLVRENVTNPTGADGKIVTSEIKNGTMVVSLIKDDKRIPGLLSAIEDYRKTSSTESRNAINDGNNSDKKSGSSYEDKNEPSNVSDDSCDNQKVEKNEQPFLPSIKLKQTEKRILINSDPISLLDEIDEATGSSGQKIDNSAITIKLDGKILNSKILPSIPEEKKIEIVFSFKDQVTGLVCAMLPIEVYQPKANLSAKAITYDLFKLPTKDNYIFQISDTLDNLFEQLKTLPIDGYLEIFACCIRPLYEIGVDAIIKSSKFPQISVRKENLGDVPNFVQFIAKNNSFIREISTSTGIDFFSCKNILQEDTYKNLIGYMNLGAHKSIMYLTKSDIENLIEKMKYFLIMVNEMLHNPKIK